MIFSAKSQERHPGGCGSAVHLTRNRNAASPAVRSAVQTLDVLRATTRPRELLPTATECAGVAPRRHRDHRAWAKPHRHLLRAPAAAVHNRTGTTASATTETFRRCRATRKSSPVRGIIRVPDAGRRGRCATALRTRPTDVLPEHPRNVPGARPVRHVRDGFHRDRLAAGRGILAGCVGLFPGRGHRGRCSGGRTSGCSTGTRAPEAQAWGAPAAGFGGSSLRYEPGAAPARAWGRFGPFSGWRFGAAALGAGTRPHGQKASGFGSCRASSCARSAAGAVSAVLAETFACA